MSSNNPQGETYWVERPLVDTERDWPYQQSNWVADYWASRSHAHRREIIKELSTIPFESLAEVGCNAGPNLDRIHEFFPLAQLAGIDLSAEAVKAAQEHLGDAASIKEGNALALPWETKSMDVLLYDAILMYIDPNNIHKAFSEIDRVAKKAVILIERHSEKTDGEILGHVWGYNFTELLKEKGFTVHEIAITPELWPTSINWQKYGRIYVGIR